MNGERQGYLDALNRNPWPALRGDSDKTRNMPVIMGILNVTPDSFFDGSLYFQLEHFL